MSNRQIWPDALALPCPKCRRILPLRGLRPDGTLFFMCPEHAYFDKASWTSQPTWPDPHVDPPWQTEAETRQNFMATALAAFLRTGVEGDFMFLVSAGFVDNFIRFTMTPGGDGDLLTEVSSRLWGCPRCVHQPLTASQEQSLFDMGFEPCVPEEKNYASDRLPVDPDWLAAISEVAFRQGFDDPDDVGISAIFDRPATAEAFYLTWSFR